MKNERIQNVLKIVKQEQPKEIMCLPIAILFLSFMGALSVNETGKFWGGWITNTNPEPVILQGYDYDLDDSFLPSSSSEEDEEEQSLPPSLPPSLLPSPFIPTDDNMTMSPTSETSSFTLSPTLFPSLLPTFPPNMPPSVPPTSVHSGTKMEEIKTLTSCLSVATFMLLL